MSVGLRVGQDFIGDPVPRLSPFIATFYVRQNGVDHDVSGADRIDPAGVLRAEGDLVMRRGPDNRVAVSGRPAGLGR